MNYTLNFLLRFYVSAIRCLPRQLVVEQKRYGSKINITKPRKPHFKRGVHNELVTPFYTPTRKTLPIWEVCENVGKSVKPLKLPSPYEIIIARECLNWFKNSRMIGFLHRNSFKAEDKLDMDIELRRFNMYTKWYSPVIFRTALTNSAYEATLPLFCSHGLIVFSPEPNVEALRKIIRKVPQVVLIAGILEGTLLNVNDFLKYGTMDITEARAGLVHTLQTAAGGNLCRQLTHHQSTFVTRLDQIHDGKIETDDIKQTKSETDTITE